MIELKLTKDEYEKLIKVVYLGEWMINSHRLPDETNEEYESVEQRIYSHAKEAGMEHLIMYDEGLKKFFPTRELEMESDAEMFREEYDNEAFWDELIDGLSNRDFVRTYGEDAIKAMTPEERFKKLCPFVDKYEDETEKRGIENLEIKD